MPAAPVRIPTYEAGLYEAPVGGTPMGTPPSAKGIAAELPFAAGNQEGSIQLTAFTYSTSSPLLPLLLLPCPSCGHSFCLASSL